MSLDINTNNNMNSELNNSNNLNNNEHSKFNVFDFIRELTERLNKMERVLVIDRFEESIAVCEDRNTKEMINIKKELLPEGAKEGSVIKFEDGKYLLDEIEEKEIEERIKNKMDDLWEN